MCGSTPKRIPIRERGLEGRGMGDWTVEEGGLLNCGGESQGGYKKIWLWFHKRGGGGYQSINCDRVDGRPKRSESVH